MKMRTTCRYGCQCDEGRIETKNGQDCVYCCECGRHQYNAPKTETGRAVRSVSTTHEAIKPAQRARVLLRDNYRCVLCGARGDLHVSHVVSVLAGHQNGMTDHEINADENLIAACPECNLGMSSNPIPIRVMLPILRARYRLDE